MTTRRDILKIGMASAAFGAVGTQKLDAKLIYPDGFIPSIVDRPSPPAKPFVAPLNVMPVSGAIPENRLRPPPNPARHQRYNEFLPQEFHLHRIQEFLWRYHPEPPYNRGSWSWGFNGITPGPTFKAHYGKPLFLRRTNELPPLGRGNVKFALPSVTIHLHNAHTASESDGIPQDFFWPGEFWDHHYANFPAGFDEREIMSTLWYHDHRLDFTAPNVYAGLTGFYLLFDELDSDNERDENPKALRLPSGDYDVPLMLHDVQFDQNGQVVWDFFNPVTQAPDVFGALTTSNGMIGDRFTVNRIIQPYFEVEPRKYRFRVLNGGPSRLYELTLQKRGGGDKLEDFYIISNDGNLLEEPIKTDWMRLGVAQRHDIIVDFSKYRPGDHVYLTNRLQMREDGAGPTGRLLDEGDQIMRFDIVRPKHVRAHGRSHRADDPSRIPDFMREMPKIDMREVKRKRLFVFDYDNGLWTVNGQLMDENRIDAAIEQGTAEIWTFRNAGTKWAHPIHTHFEEFQILEWNGRPVKDGDRLRARKDVVMLFPGDEVTFFGRWRDFFGPHVMHCHNVVHEDHAMMVRWDIVEPGKGF